jgi:hypothetical protein
MSIAFGPRIDSTCAICYNDLADPDYLVDEGAPGAPDLKSDLFVSPCHGRHTFHYVCAKGYFDSKQVARRSATCPVCVQPPAWQAEDFPAEPGLEERQALHAAQERERQENADRMEAVRMHEAENRARQETAAAAHVEESPPMAPRRLFYVPQTVERLMYAIDTQNEDSIREVIREQPLLRDFGLWYACGFQTQDVLQTLVDLGADVNSSQSDERPIDRARVMDQPDTVEWLIAHGAAF